MPDWERKVVDGVDSVVYSCGCSWPVVGEPVAPSPLPRIKVDPRHLPECDATWDLLAKGLTKGVFQLESQLGRQWTKKMKPKSMEHMSGLVALLRPGCLNAKDENGVSMTEHYVKRANNEEPVEEVHEALRNILGPTYNVMTYQEQAMQIVVAVAGFTPNEADMMRKAAGKKDTAGMAKVEKMFMEGVRREKIIDEELGLKLMSWIKESQRYAFNRCTSERQIIKRPSKDKHHRKWGMEVGDMYRMMNDLDYAKATNRMPLRSKMRRCGYGYGLSIGDDGRIRQNRIVDIQPAGKQKVYNITLENGDHCEVTINHKFPTPHGDKPLSELKPGDELYCQGDYEKTDSRKYNWSSFTNEDRNVKTGESGKGQYGEINRCYTNGSWSDFQKNKVLLPKECFDCKLPKKRIEIHHINGDRTNSKLENLMPLCAGCHKKREYAAGRVKRGEKGYPTIVSKILTIELVGEAETYDVTMEAPHHNFVVMGDHNCRGIVTCNSHAMCYGYAGYDSAYLKAHFPTQFFCSWLAWAKEGADPLEETNDLVMDAKQFDIPVETPDARLLRSDTWTDGVRVIFGMAEVSGIGSKQVAKLRASVTALAEQTAESFANWSWEKVLWEAIPVIQKNVAERLIIVGAFRHLGIARRRMLAELNAVQTLSKGELAWCQEFVKKNGYPGIIEVLRACAATKKQGGGCHDAKRVPIVKGVAQAIESPMSPLVDSPLWISNMEKQYLGIAISCTKIDSCDIADVNCSCRDFASGRTDRVMALGVQIDQLREVTTKSGKSAGRQMAYLKVSDTSGPLDNICVFPDRYEQYRNVLREGNTVLLVGKRDERRKDSFIVESASQLA